MLRNKAQQSISLSKDSKMTRMITLLTAAYPSIMCVNQNRSDGTELTRFHK